PATDFIAGFVGYVNSLEGKIQMVDLENGLLRIETEQGLIKVLAGNKDIKEREKVNVVIRPENITLMPPDDIVRDNLFFGEISNSMYTGSLIKYVIKTGQHIFIAEQYNPRKFGIIQIGEKVAMEISKDLHILKKER
ncbi:TOBE domain-containing protein, partial [bacterium]|nr:TOBE domain-containing protein [bacterium]